MPETNTEIDTTNRFMVARMGHGTRILLPTTGVLTPDDALNLAAYLVAMNFERDDFDEILKAVRNT